MNRLKLQITLAIMLWIAFSSGTVGAFKLQSPAIPADPRTLGITQYQQGQNNEAITSLKDAVKRNKDDVRAWHYLGLALGRNSDIKGSRAAHEKAAKSGEKQLDSWLAQATSAAEVSRIIPPISVLLGEAADSGTEYLKLSPSLSKSEREEWDLRINALRAFADADGDSGIGTVYRSSEVDIKARVLSKPMPDFTTEAMQHHTSGTVILKVIFTSYGKVAAIRAIHGLPDGLTEASIQAARKIKFVPAMKAGRPVSMYAQLEYSFSF